jgi:hypothetical protein
MERASTVRSRPALAIAALGLLGVSTELGGCITVLSLDHRPCPCVTGYECCRELDQCFLPTESKFCPKGEDGAEAGSGAMSVEGGSPSEGGSASEGSSASGGAAPGGTAGEVGSGAGDAGEAQGGTGVVVPSKPEWLPVGNDDDIAPPLTSDPNLALAPDGTPYIAYRACEPCQPIDQRTDIPVVLRLGDTWERLPPTGLGEITKGSPALATGLDGAPHVLIDYERQLKRFEDGQWTAVSPQFELSIHLPAALERDTTGRFYTLLTDEVNVKLVVARVEDPTTYSFLGTSLTGDNGTARLCVVGTDVYRAYVFDQGPNMSRVFVDHFNGGDWDNWGDFEGRSIELTASKSGDVYVAVSDYELRTANILKRSNDAWETLFPNLTASWHAPLLQVSSSGELYLAYLVEDFPNVNVIANGTWRDVKSRDLPNGSNPVLRLWESKGTVVPIISYLIGGGLVARKYQ